MKIFISWAKKNPTGDFAMKLHEWIPQVFPNLKTWCSADPQCLPQGPGFPNHIMENIADSDICLAILSCESVNEKWVNFETGAFFGMKKPVFALLCEGVTHQTLASQGHPLSSNGINYTSFTPESLTAFFISIHALDCSTSKPSADNIKKSVDRWFADLSGEYNKIFNDGYKAMNALLVQDTKM